MLNFMTDPERQAALAEAFELDDTTVLHPNVKEFYDRHLAVLDSERLEHLISLVERAKARAVGRVTA